jgi:hypothetical protein
MRVIGIGLYANGCFVRYAITLAIYGNSMTLCYVRPVSTLQVCKTGKKLPTQIIVSGLPSLRNHNSNYEHTALKSSSPTWATSISRPPRPPQAH